MAFDACMMRAMLSEFTTEFPEAKIEKVYQPMNDEIVFAIRGGKSGGRLVFNVGPNAPRLQLSSVTKENPLKAPMFCMLLRKRLGGARIVSVEQPGFDRIAKFTVSGYDEMGFKTEMYAVCEIMGKYANFLLLDSEEKIISALKLIDFSASDVRQILPGLTYRLPAMPKKIPPVEMTRQMLTDALDAFGVEKSVEKFITSTYSGVATQIAHELAYRASGQIDIPLVSVDRDKLVSVLLEWQQLLISERYTPTVAKDKLGKPLDYSYMSISYFKDSATYTEYPTFGAMFDAYFEEKDRLERIHQRAHDVKQLLSNTINRTTKKLSLQREALANSESAGVYKRDADLITANMYKLSRGDKFFMAIDYYSEDCPTVRVELDSRLTPAANAQRLYKLYNKAKTAKIVLAEQIAKWEAELEYLNSVKAFLDNAESEADIADIREELYKSGYASRMKGYKPAKGAVAKPYTFVTENGFTLLVGRNNLQNDRLTHKDASKDDIWFHVKDFPGSHVILVTDGKEPEDIDYTQAAEIAAGYSAASGVRVAVDYTRVKNVKKPAGSKPGFVIYKTNYTAYVMPKKKLGV